MSCSDSEEHCITCSDEGIPMRVVEVQDAAALCIDRERTQHVVATDLVEPIAAGDELLVHAGVAIGRL